MPAPEATQPGSGTSLEFLCVNEYIRELVGARALKTGFELGLIDRLMEGPAGIGELQDSIRCDPGGLAFLVDLLVGNRVLERQGDRYALSTGFSMALRYRDLLEAKLDFAGFLAGDFLDLFTALIAEPASFQDSARLFKLFDYRRALEPGVENYRHTRAWMRLTTALTRYEAGVCLNQHDFRGYRRMLDIGGNSGEFVLQLCRAHPQLRATVLDLPVVCEVGQAHILPEAERDRIGFIKADIRNDALPAGYDLISFKSMLHDWPDQDALQFLDKAAAALEPGGTLMILERSPLPARKGVPAFHMLPILLFFRSYRPWSFYTRHLGAMGLQQVEVREFAIETPFYLITASKPA